MLYKLYISQIDPENKLTDKELETIFKGFQKIYTDNNVQVVGAWRNIDDSNEEYLITAYNDVEHYNEAVANMRANTEYQKLTESRKGSVKSTRVITLTTLPGSPN